MQKSSQPSGRVTYLRPRSSSIVSQSFSAQVKHYHRARPSRRPDVQLSRPRRASYRSADEVALRSLIKPVLMFGGTALLTLGTLLILK